MQQVRVLDAQALHAFQRPFGEFRVKVSVAANSAVIVFGIDQQGCGKTSLMKNASPHPE